MVVVHQMMPVVERESIETKIDRLFDDAIRGSSTWKPNCNVYEDENNFCVQIAVPGLSVSQLDVRMEHNTLLVKGARKNETSEGKTWYAREFEEGPFACSFQLPSHVNCDAASTAYDQGVLTITFAKREEAKPRRIMITPSSVSAQSMIDEDRERTLKRSIKAASLLVAGFIGLGVWSAWSALLT
jgi:HSP20 family protein